MTCLLFSKLTGLFYLVESPNFLAEWGESEDGVIIGLVRELSSRLGRLLF